MTNGRGFGERSRDAFDRATARARDTLRPGDRVTLNRCGGRHTVTFVGWVDHHGLPDPHGRCMASKTLDDLSAWNVIMVNGQSVTFRDREGIEATEADMVRFEQEAAYRRAAEAQRRRQAIRAVGGDW